MKKKTATPLHCGIAAHEAMKASRSRIETETSFVGWQRDAGCFIEVRNCKRCLHTVGIPSGFRYSIKPRA